VLAVKEASLLRFSGKHDGEDEQYTHRPDVHQYLHYSEKIGVEGGVHTSHGKETENKEQGGPGICLSAARPPGRCNTDHCQDQKAASSAISLVFSSQPCLAEVSAPAGFLQFRVESNH